MRWATLVLVMLLGCNDLREFRGDWRGPRVGDAPVLRAGIGDGAAQLSIDGIDEHGLRARLAIEGLLPETPITSLPGAEADALAGLTFGGAPLRVYLAFAAVPDAGGDALVVVSLYDDRRLEVRVLRGGTKPLYGIFALTESAT
ncbi:MAG TPA: hypothetical protein VHN14_12650 [Kofleriaceae bacterium]|nr:hypothetical protein [Kofleriaceae bacterium]